MTENILNISTENKEDIVLIFIYQKKTIREMAKLIHKQIGTIQIVMKTLEDKGLVENNFHKKAGRSLTRRGIQRLHQIGVKVL